MGYINVKSDRLYSNISNEYNPQTKYAVGNYCYYDGTIKKCTSAVADYSKTAAYAIGDYCYHEDSGTNNLYKCNTAIPDPGEEWTASHWTLTTELPTGKWVSVVVTDELGGGGSVDLTCVAPLYEETTEYHANDIVLHGGKVYYCKGDSATGPWTPSEWIECPISKLLIYDAIAPIWSTQYEYQSGSWTTYRGHLYICAVETSTQGEFKEDEWYKISIDKTLHSMVHAIVNWTAPWFNEYENYEKNAYVMHLQDPADVSSARLYKAKYNLTAGAWAQDDWEETTVVAMREDLAYQKSVTRNVWSENAEYSYGDVVMFKGKLCKAVVDIPTKGEFKNDEWDFTDTFTELKLTVSNLYVKGAGKTYYPGDIIQADGGIYKAVMQTTDTNPFSPIQEVEESASLTAVTQGTNVFMAATEMQSAMLATIAMSGSGKANIKYIGTVDGVDINETVECTFAMANRAYIGTLSNGWTFVGALMYPAPPYPFAFMIMDGSTAKLVDGDTATVAVIDTTTVWKQTYIDREPLPTFVIKNDHDFALWLEADPNYNYEVVSLTADVTYSGTPTSTISGYTKLFIGNNHRITFKLPATLRNNLYYLPCEMKDTHIVCTFENGVTYTSDSDTDISLFNFSNSTQPWDVYNRNKLQNCSFYLVNEGTTTPACFNTTVITKLRLFNCLTDTEFRFFNDCSFKINLTINTTTSLTDFYLMYESNYYFYKHAFANNCDFYITIESSTKTDRIIDNFIISRGVKHSKTKIMVMAGVKNFWCLDTYAEGCDIVYEGDDDLSCLNFYGIYGSNTIATGNRLESWIVPSATTHATACTYLDPIATNNLNRSALFTNNTIYNINKRLSWSDYVTITNHYNNHAYDQYSATTSTSTNTTTEVWNDDVKANNVSIAAEFVAGGTYTVGQFVMYKNDLYKCNTAGTYASWDATKFTQTKVTDELGGGGGAVTSVNGLTGAVVLDGNNVMVDSTATNAPVAIKAALETKSNDAAIAEEFSTTKGYTVDDLVMHNNNLYKAKYTRSARAWSDANWTQVKVADYLKSTGIVWDPVAEDYDSSTQYHSGDIVIHDNKMYRSINSCIGTFNPSDWTQTTAAKIACAPYTYVIRTDEDLACFMNCNIKSGETASEKFKNVGFSLEQQSTFTYYGDIANFGTIFSSGDRCNIWGNGAVIDVAYSPDYDTANQWNYVFDFCEFHDATIKTTLGDLHEKDADFALFANCGFHNCTVDIPDNMYLEYRNNVPNRIVRVVYNGTASEDTKFILPLQVIPKINNVNFFNFAGIVKNCYFDIQGETDEKITIVCINAVSGFYNNRIIGALRLGVDSSVTSDCTLLNMNNASEVMSDNDIRFEFVGGNLVNVVNCNGCAKNNYIFVKLEDIIVAYGLIATNAYKDCSGNSIYFENTSCCKVYGIMTSGSLVHDNFIYMSPGSTSTYSSTYICYGIYCQTSTPRTIKGNTIQFITCTNFNFYGIFAIESTTIDGNNILATNGPDEDCNTFRGIYCSNGGCYIMNNTIDARLHDGVGGAISYIHCMNYGRYKIIDNTIIHGCSNSDHTIVHTSIIIKAIQVATNIGSIVQQNKIFNRIDNVQGNVEATWKINNVFDVATGIDVTNNIYYDET